MLSEYTQVEFVLVQYAPNQAQDTCKNGQSETLSVWMYFDIITSIRAKCIVFDKKQHKKHSWNYCCAFGLTFPIAIYQEYTKRITAGSFCYLQYTKRITAGSFCFEIIPRNKVQQKRTKKVGNVRETCKVKESLNSSFLKLDKVGNIGSKGFFGMIQAANKVNSSGI